MQNLKRRKERSDFKTDRIRRRLKEIQVENMKRRKCEWKRESKETRMKMLKTESNTYQWKYRHTKREKDETSKRDFNAKGCLEVVNYLMRKKIEVSNALLLIRDQFNKSGFLIILMSDYLKWKRIRVIKIRNEKLKNQIEEKKDYVYSFRLKQKL